MGNSSATRDYRDMRVSLEVCIFILVSLACARASARLLDNDNILIDNEMSECDNFTLPQTIEYCDPKVFGSRAQSNAQLFYAPRTVRACSANIFRYR